MKFDFKELERYASSSFISHEKHPDADLHIFGYSTQTGQPVIWNDTTKHCRGLIVDGQGNVVEHPFVKFWTFRQYLSDRLMLLNDNQVMRVPNGHFKIKEKIDGSMCVLYWIGNIPYLATQRSFVNHKAKRATQILHTKYSQLFPKLDRRYTYIFEAVYPEAKVLIDYQDKEDLYLIGKIDRDTGKPCDIPDIGFPVAKDYTLVYSEISNFDELIKLNLPNQEGFVLYFEDGSMIKLKFPWYQELHHLLDSLLNLEKAKYRTLNALRHLLKRREPVISNIDVWQSFAKGDVDLFEVRSQVPSYFYLMGFEEWLMEIKREILNGVEASVLKKDGGDCPQRIKYFNFSKRMQNPNKYESMIINWEKRYL